MTNEILSRYSNTAATTTTMAPSAAAMATAATTGRQKKQVGTQITSLHDSVDGFGCERDHSFIIIPTPLKRKHHKKVGTPTIYFPEPPPSSEPSSPSHSQSTTSTSTSDTSSIYYIKKHKNRRHHLYSKRPKRVTTLNHREYATITKKQIERAQKKAKQKHKYLKSGNRIAAAFDDTVQVHSSRSSATAQNSDDGKQHSHDNRAAECSDGTFEMSIGKNSNLYEHIEAFNPMVGKKKVHNQFTSTKQIDKNGTTAISNKESERHSHEKGKSRLIDKRQNKKGPVNQLKHGANAFVVNSANGRQKRNNDQQHAKASNHSSSTSDESMRVKMNRFSNQLSNNDATKDDLSIGSFLSMASIRSFPKCNVPEPLNRVLEPVAVPFQYDEIEATEAATMASKLPRIVDATAKPAPNQQPYMPRENLIQQKNDDTVYLSRTRSDGADPGVIGPIAWQYHKKQLEDQGEFGSSNESFDVSCSFSWLCHIAIQKCIGTRTALQSLARFLIQIDMDANSFVFRTRTTAHGSIVYTTSL